jgi:6-phosphogluconate dehydrogenase
LIRELGEGGGIVDGGDSDFEDDVRRAKELASKGVCEHNAEVWRRGGLVVSWLLDLLVTARREPAAPRLQRFRPGLGRGRSTDMAVIEEAGPAGVLSSSLDTRLRSRHEQTFAEKVLSAMRHRFGGHVERPTGG